MDDPLTGPDVSPILKDNSAPSKAANQAEPLFRFPPFPETPAGVKIIPFKDFKEHGIQIFNEDEELDGLGIPTVPLRVNHTTDKSKTTAKKLKKEEDEKLERKNKLKGKKGSPGEKLDPVAKAQEQRRQRYLLFAKKEWYEQWAEGEDLRGSRTYDQNLSPIDRIHMASTEFRTGRIWPPGYMKVNYLWDQFRLYVGLLGSPPVWTRIDLPQPEDPDDFDDETDSDVELTKIEKEKEKLTRKPKDSDEEDNDELLFSDENDSDNDSRNQKDRTNSANHEDQKPPQAKFKRIPPRTPYALYNIVPIPVSSDEEVRKLLAIAAGRRESRLLKFLADPELSVRIFLSWYLRHESLIWSPNYLVSFPHIVQFFLSFVVRVKALPESERALKKAVDIAKQGILELGRTGKLCRELPDKFGIGMKALYGKRWVEERWKIDFLEDESNASVLQSEVDHEVDQSLDADAPQDEFDNDTKEKALKRFEEELRAENVELLPADPVNLGVSAADLQIRDGGNENVPEQISQRNVNVVLADETDSPSYLENVKNNNTVTDPIQLQPTLCKQEEVTVDATSNSITVQESQSAVTNAFSTTTQLDDATSKSEDPILEPDIPADDLDWSKPDGKINAVEKEAAKAAWEPPHVQPLMEIFGMTVLPLKYDAGGHGGPNKYGVAERSMRKVKAVYKPGEPDKDRKWRGIEEELTQRLSRIVLAPWLDWDSGSVEVDYDSPKVQGDSVLENADDGHEQKDQSKYAARYAHDPEKDDITVLMEPLVADLVMVGMGMAGVFVQLVPNQGDSQRTHTERGRGRGRGGGRFNATGSGGRQQKEFTFWYVEHLQLAVPSFWTPGEEEKPITREELEDALELDLDAD